MRQAFSEYDERDDGFGLVGEERAQEPLPRDRRFPMLLLTVCVMALFAGGLYFAYVAGTRHPAATAPGGKVPLIRADSQPSKIRPAHPGGMKIPDQNVSLYNEKEGGPPVEKLLPAPEQPLPRPAPPPKAPAMTRPVAPAPAAATRSPAPTATAAAPPAAAPPAPSKRLASTAASATRRGRVHLHLGSLRTPQAARAEWHRLKRRNPDLLGKMTAVAVRTDLGEKGIYYRIQAGSFADRAAAEKLCAELKRRKFGCILAR